ncbi:MAG: hypothetical protein ACNA7J_03240 [Wenzhouxiangella sp.]
MQKQISNNQARPRQSRFDIARKRLTLMGVLAGELLALASMSAALLGALVVMASVLG